MQRSEYANNFLYSCRTKIIITNYSLTFNKKAFFNFAFYFLKDKNIMYLSSDLFTEVYFMVKTPVFKGSCTALITPFDKDGKPDYQRLKANIDFQYENGTSAIVICGTTGEGATVSANEYEELTRFAVREVNGKMKVIAGIGGNNTLTAYSKAESAKFLGADAVLMVTPYYNKTTQKGLIDHFSYVADRVDIPMILYNVPSRTGMSISPDTYKKLSEHPNIVGVKEASGDISHIGQIISRCGNDLYVWSGNDDNTVPMMALGALGVISVASNIVPGVVSKLCRHCLDGEYAEAAELTAKYTALFNALFIETNPIPIKTAMKMLGADSGVMRLPLTEMSESNYAFLKNTLVSSGFNII